ncbi:DCN1-like protein 3 [Adelges cooleyi]|uniref:DCN1-like protein 3 n=1 Tax=Adelges cooleyi TaxID=133065 RepID=UPI00217F6846|nr:DCN1-like protein 3 [Adelges cooleyi]
MGICFSRRPTSQSCSDKKVLDTQVKELNTTTATIHSVVPMTNATDNSANTGSDNGISYAFKSLTSSLMSLFGSADNTAAKRFQIRVEKLFDVYKEPSVDLISIDGIERLCNDLEILPEEFRILVFAWKCNAHQMCQLKRVEFAKGCLALNADSIELMRTKLSEMVSDLNYNSKDFKSLYRFTFKFGLDNNKGQRILPVDTAIVLWQLVFDISEPAILQRWLTFLENSKSVHGIPKDTWNMFLCFAESVPNGDLTNYDDSDAWPSVFDDFVEHENHQAKKTE